MSVRLFVLGLVATRDIHGYEIKEVARLWGVERWARIGFGSIYHALGKLQEEGLIEERSIDKEGNHPPRTVFRITDPGKTAFFELLRATCRKADLDGHDIDMALAFLHHLPPDERQALLRERLTPLGTRLEGLKQSVAGYERALASEPPEADEYRKILRQVPWVLAAVRHSLARAQVEWDWTVSLQDEVTKWPTAMPQEQEEGQE